MLSILIRYELLRMFRPSAIAAKLALGVGCGVLACRYADSSFIAALVVPLVLYLAGCVGWADAVETNADGELAAGYVASRPLSRDHIDRARTIALGAGGGFVASLLVVGLMLSEQGQPIAPPWFLSVVAAWGSVILGGQCRRDEWLPERPKT